MSAVPGTTTPGSGWKICTEKEALLDTARLPGPVPVLSCYHEKPSLLQESRNLQTQPFFNLLNWTECPALRYTYCLPAVRSREGEGNGKGEGEDGHSNHYFPAPVNLFLCCVYICLPGVHISDCPHLGRSCAGREETDRKDIPIHLLEDIKVHHSTNVASVVALFGPRSQGRTRNVHESCSGRKSQIFEYGLISFRARISLHIRVS